MIYLLLLFIPYCLLTSDIENMAIVFSILLILDIIINYRQKSKISYLDIWNLGFLFMVTSEMILSHQTLSLQEYGLTAVRYIFMANVLFNLGFRVEPVLSKKNNQHFRTLKKAKNFGQPNKKVMYFLLVLALFYFTYTIQNALTVFIIGRNEFLGNTVEGDISVLGKILTGISYFVPIAAAFYCRYYLQYKKKILLVLIILLCALPHVFSGTRYLLLFSLIAPLIVLFDRKQLSSKLVVGISAVLFAIISLSSFIKYNRNSINITTYNTKNYTVAEQLASLGSDENVVKRGYQLFQYTNDNGYHYGKESAFILYFWVPRSIWPEKPTKIGHWLTNKYENVSDSYSAAYGFWGQLFIDFGYFSFVILFFLGGIIRKLDMKKDRSLSDRSKISILYIALFPVLFLSVRSPQTALINFVLITLVYIVLGYIFKKLGVIKKRKNSQINRRVAT